MALGRYKGNWNRPRKFWDLWETGPWCRTLTYNLPLSSLELLTTGLRGPWFSYAAYHQRLVRHGWQQQFVLIPPWDSHQEDELRQHFCQELESRLGSWQKSFSGLWWPFPLHCSQSESSSQSQLCPRWCRHCHCHGCKRLCHLHHHGSYTEKIECGQSLYLSTPNIIAKDEDQNSNQFCWKTWADPSLLGKQAWQWEFPEYMYMKVSGQT